MCCPPCQSSLMASRKKMTVPCWCVRSCLCQRPGRGLTKGQRQLSRPPQPQLPAALPCTAVRRQSDGSTERPKPERPKPGTRHQCTQYVDLDWLQTYDTLYRTAHSQRTVRCAASADVARACAHHDPCGQEFERDTHAANSPGCKAAAAWRGRRTSGT